MSFNKNQSNFASDFSKSVWWWAIGIVPPADSLTEDVRSKCSFDVLEGCHQWHTYFNALCEDMYNNENMYLPASPRQYRDILECIAAGGVIAGDSISWHLKDWEAYQAKINRSKAYTTAGIDLSQCLQALSRTGLVCKYADENVIFSHERYPKIFHAMKVMEESPGIRKTPARHHFAHCEFRQLFKEYSANYDELLRRASDESLHIVHSIHDFCKPLKIQRYIHFGIVKYKYKNIRILDFNLYGDEYPTLRVNMGTCANPDRMGEQVLNPRDSDSEPANTDSDLLSDAYYQVLLAQNERIQDAFLENIVKCESSDHTKRLITINGREEWLCPCVKIRINPVLQDLEMILACISARKASIDQLCG